MLARMTSFSGFPNVTSLYAAGLGLFYVALSIRVVTHRARTGVMHGDGGEDRLNRAIRAHANFSEYVPFILLLAAMAEMGGAGARSIHLLLGPLSVARLMHPVGMEMPIGSLAQYGWRATSMTITWLVLVAACALLIARWL
jgi:uncharacterized membrane protein YecN with MAPEG domain